MSTSELSESNYRRIAYINWALSVPLLLIFSWPFYFLCEIFHIYKAISFPGSIIFGLPFMLTILHGHVTMALGASHRQHYYAWLKERPLTYGLLFHNIIISTRFRLSLFFLSMFILLIGFIFT
ncbi:hypothetical protein [Rhodohalobacter sulfatireducens]|uniref:Succinate dehydrogenase n=1 Tax=Rhodohalobacter sulfatireducens TaxID=2911366 RepID=A0ABS9K9C0_9BACT|nr:hypothetical protein [Rhodohalobacter sulfatireducens]MCG2587442.1 hypothetical protein [Rhodohalobacter sulfatireducens]MDR9366889.1 hypothetical protein [Balneolaceae bacterium]MDR9410213.1 hypothetical protein [Balneolaceae bacterium]